MNKKYRVLRPIILSDLRRVGEIVELDEEYARGNDRLEEVIETASEEVNLEEMSDKQLKKYAKAKGIDLGEAKTKEEMIAVISEVETASEE